MKNGAIVLGGHVQGYGIVKLLGESNIASIVIDRTFINIARHSKYCIKYYNSEYENLLNLLKEFANKGKYKNWVLIPTDDYYVRILSQNKKTLQEHFKVSVDDWNVIDIFFNKRNSYPLAESVEVPIPNTFYPDSIEELKECSTKIEYPCIIKPAIMLDFYRYFKQKVFICKNYNELLKNYLKASVILKPQEIMVQEIIPGGSENQYSVGIFYDKNRSYNYLVGRRRHQHPIDFGNATTFAETVNIPELVNYAEKILRKANFWGLCEVEFKYDERDGKYKFLEVNPRTWKWHTIAQKAGIPFLKSMYNYLTFGSPIIENEYKPACWQDIVTDIPVIFEMKKKKMYKKVERNNLVNAVANIKDIKPFLFQIFYIPYLVLKR